jgi:hypothetical protein
MTRTLQALIAVTALLGAGAARAQGAAAFAPGEETRFRVTFLGLNTGEGKISIGPAQGALWPVIFQAKTNGVASLLDVREHLAAYWDADQQLTRGTDLTAYELGDFHQDSARFDRERNQVTVVEQRRGKERKEKTLDIAEGTLDLTGSFLWLRQQPLEVGRRLELPVVTGTTKFTLVAEVMGHEEIRTPAGTFPAYKLSVHTEIPGKFSTRRESFLWLADRPGQFLVRASADFAVGSVVVELTAYEPGTATLAVVEPGPATVTAAAP